MKRKKAIKKKKEELAKLDIEIYSKVNAMIDWANERKVDVDKRPPPFLLLAECLRYAIQLKTLCNQRNILSSQPIPPKKLKKGVGIFQHHKDMSGPKIYGGMETEKILNAPNHNNLSTPCEISSGDITINANKNIIDKLDSLEIRFKE